MNFMKTAHTAYRHKAEKIKYSYLAHVIIFVTSNLDVMNTVIFPCIMRIKCVLYTETRNSILLRYLYNDIKWGKQQRFMFCYLGRLSVKQKRLRKMKKHGYHNREYFTYISSHTEH